MENLTRKQVLKNGLIEFAKNTTQDKNVYSIQTDTHKGYWIYKGVIYDNKIFNLNSAQKIKNTNLDKNTIYYISTITESQIALFNIK